MTLMGDGLKKVAGSKLEVILYRLTSTPLKGVLLGTVVTAMIQSSSATSVMVIGFVNSGMMKISQAIGTIMGANIGTSVTGWILCLSYLDGNSGSVVSLLSTATLAAVIALVGILLRMFAKSTQKRYIGEVLLGFAVLMYGMQSMSGAVAPLKESEAFVETLTMFRHPVLGILVGIVITAILQSASASVGILQALAATGAVSFATALPITMGMGIGAAVPVLISGIGARRDGKRIALIYLLNDLFGTVFWSIVFYGVNYFAQFDFMDMSVGPVGVALINTVFRIASILVLLPFIKQLERLVRHLVKDDPQELADTAEINNLEERFIRHPALAIEQSRLALCSMANKAQENVEAAHELLESYSDPAFRRLEEKEAIVDRYEDKVGSYLVKTLKRELSSAQTNVITKFLHAISDFERISDHAMNIAEVAQEIHDKGISFSPEALSELQTVYRAVDEVMHLSVLAFLDDDLELAKRVEPLEELIDILCDEAKLHHVNRIQSGVCTLNQGFVFNDLLTNYERISDHCSNIAVAMIELSSDSFDTHEYLSSLKEMKSDTFDRYFEEYSKKYSF